MSDVERSRSCYFGKELHARCNVSSITVMLYVVMYTVACAVCVCG